MTILDVLSERLEKFELEGKTPEYIEVSRQELREYVEFGKTLENVDTKYFNQGDKMVVLIAGIPLRCSFRGIPLRCVNAGS
jgi:hypothetical protein